MNYIFLFIIVVISSSNCVVAAVVGVEAALALSLSGPIKGIK